MKRILKTIAIMLGVICLAIIIPLGISIMPMWMQVIVIVVCLIIMASFIYEHI